MKNKYILEIYAHLRDDVEALRFSAPAAHAYNPLRYAWNGFSQYMAKCSEKPRVVFLGMNPGPYGMAQTGVPFGEIDAVKNFMGITHIEIAQNDYNAKGLECTRSEVSGRRLWGLFRERFGTAEAFFHEHIVLNYCPLLFLKEGNGRMSNLTPDKLAVQDREALFAMCDECLRSVVDALGASIVVGVGAFAEKKASESLQGVRVVRILHPSPASPASNHDWAGKVTQQLIDSEVWT